MIYEADFIPYHFVGLSLIEDKKMLAISYNFPHLYMLDLNKNKIKYFSDLPVKLQHTYKPFQSSFKIGDYIFILPFNEDVLLRYSLIDNTFSSLSVKEYIASANDGKYMNIIQSDDKIYLIPYSADKIITVDYMNMKIINFYYISDVKKENDLFYSVAKDESGNIYMPSRESNLVIKINSGFYSFETINIGDSEWKYSYALYDRNKLWLIVRNRSLFVSYDLLSGETEMYRKFPDGFAFEKGSCFDSQSIYKIGDYIYCFPANSNMAIKFNILTKEILELKCFERYFYNRKFDKSKFIVDGSYFDGKFIFLYCQNNTILLYDTVSDNIEEHIMELCLDSNNTGFERFMKSIDKEWH